jgi:F-type H+-transporting ATPase subunit epsilon
MKLSIVTPKKVIFEGEIDYVVVKGDHGELAIMKNHVPTIVPIKEGFVKRVTEDNAITTYLSGSIVEFSHNIVTVIAQEAEDGNTFEEAKKNFYEARTKVTESNREQAINFAEIERKLALNLKEIKAGKL